MHYEQQQLKYAGLHFHPVFNKLFYKLPISKQNYQVIFYQITIAIFEISDFISFCWQEDKIWDILLENKL